MIKIFLAIIVLILYESLDLYLKGIFEHPLAFIILKILFLNKILLMIVFIKANILIKIKETIPPILKTAEKNDIKSSKNTKERLKLIKIVFLFK